MQTVVVATYDHEYGIDVRVFSSVEKAKAWADEIASESWFDFYPDEEMPSENIGVIYFQGMRGCFEYPESFHMMETIIE